MSIQAAQQMGFTCLSLDPSGESPASQVAPAVTGSLSNVEAVAQLFRNCARVTLENEFIPAEVIVQALELSGRDPSTLVPNVEALATIQDKLKQRQALAKAGVPGPRAVEIDSDGVGAVAKIGFPMVLKARFGGYDGKGTRYAKSKEEFEDLRSTWSDGGWMAEEFVDFKRELAVMVFRDPVQQGAFPTMETVQVKSVCDLVFPADVDASEVAMAAVEAVDGFGLFGVELFETNDGKFLINELAPRPHNTGHYTLNWGGPSQFQHHVRLVLGLPPAPLDGVPTCMANLLGQPGAGDWRQGLFAATVKDPAVAVHWYGKAVAAPGRKMGHLNVAGADCVARAKAARERFYAAWTAKESVPEEIG
ncbi:MAG: ATP-grasp domain-containing protein [Chthonomonas sp.]|nr:ATP-grasp domain-containing protein [Chthonomonas sp.]